MFLTRLSLYKVSYYICSTFSPGLTEATTCDDGYTPKMQSGSVIPMIASGELNPPKQGVYLSGLCRVSA